KTISNFCLAKLCSAARPSVASSTVLLSKVRANLSVFLTDHSSSMTRMRCEGIDWDMVMDVIIREDCRLIAQAVNDLQVSIFRSRPAKGSAIREEPSQT